MTRAEAGYLGYLKAKENNTLGTKQKEMAIKKWEEKKKKCLSCGEILPFEKRQNGKFCGHHCSAIYSNKIRGNKSRFLPEHNCLNCQTSLDWKHPKYCSYKCQQEYYYKSYIKDWKDGKINGDSKPRIRKYLFEKYNNKCSLCGWDKKNVITNKTPLEVEHIDGNSKNNKEENLTLLCPNCHSLTPTYKALNKGNGRFSRMKRYVF